jgi:hypothetical protein
MEGCKKKVVNFQHYVSIFDKKVDGIILDLKKQSFALANEGSEDEETNKSGFLDREENSIIIEEKEE